MDPIRPGSLRLIFSWSRSMNFGMRPPGSAQPVNSTSRAASQVWASFQRTFLSAMFSLCHSPSKMSCCKFATPLSIHCPTRCDLRMKSSLMGPSSMNSACDVSRCLRCRDGRPIMSSLICRLRGSVQEALSRIAAKDPFRDPLRP